jgi:hypothetical protein
LVVVGDNGPFFDFPTFGKGRKRRCSIMVLHKIEKYRHGFISVIAIEEMAVPKEKKKECMNKHMTKIYHLRERVGGAVWRHTAR